MKGEKLSEFAPELLGGFLYDEDFFEPDPKIKEFVFEKAVYIRGMPPFCF